MWSYDEILLLTANYPVKGKQWCMKKLNRSEASVRYMAAKLNLRLDDNSEFCREWQHRAAKSKIGKKVIKQSETMKRKVADGNWKNPMGSLEARNKVSRIAKERIASKGHPKGALGLKHTEKTKSVISEKSKSMWANMTDEMRDEFSKRASINGKNSANNRIKCTWKAGWRQIGDNKKYYRSRWEANYARYLEWLKKHKQIISWEHEPKTFWFEGIKRGVMSYLPDFRVVELNGAEIYHEVKGWMDDRSKTKIKRMAKYYPEVKLIVIDAKSYKALEKKLKVLLSDWE